MKLTIHQPNFFPWLPFFEKWSQADRLVMITGCQFSKGGFQDRFRVGENSFRMQVHPGMVPIFEKEYKKPAIDWQKIVLAFPQHGWLRYHRPVCPSLVTMNVKLILVLAEKLRDAGILPDMTDAAINSDAEPSGTDRLIRICRRHGADTYLSGPSGLNYLEMEKFEAAGIAVEFFEATDKRHVLEVL